MNELVLDLRYNGGGLVSIGRALASYVNPALTAGQTYASLLYNDKRSAQNRIFALRHPEQCARADARLCAAGPAHLLGREQVINGLRPFVSVVQIGDTTCGKPVGFLPAMTAAARPTASSTSKS